jgi:hypothetical protein
VAVALTTISAEHQVMVAALVVEQQLLPVLEQRTPAEVAVERKTLLAQAETVAQALLFFASPIRSLLPRAQAIQ